MTDRLVLRFANTIGATAHGLTDALATTETTRDWLGSVGPELSAYLNMADYRPTETDRAVLTALRQAVRSLFAEAVAPHPPSSADATALPPLADAVASINAAATPVLRQLVWDTEPFDLHTLPELRDTEIIAARLAEDAIDFFADPMVVAEVRACPAPRCVLYFRKRHPRQEWCSVACGNRARAARFYRHHK